MIRKLLLITLIINLISCNAQDAKPSLEQAKTDINTTLDSWHKAAADADFDAYFGLMDEHSVFVGTDAKEVWDKQAFMEFSKPYFDKGKAWAFTKISRNIYYTSGDTHAWFDETLNTWMGVCRGSGVLQYKNRHWIIKHYVLSLAVPNEKMKDVISIISDVGKK